MEILTAYLLVGIIWDILYNHIVDKVNTEYKLSTSERTFSLLAWPIVVSIFLYHFIKSYMKND
mgnify:FL=1